MTLEQAAEQVRLANQLVRESKTAFETANTEQVRAKKAYLEAEDRLSVANRQLVEIAQGFTYDWANDRYEAVIVEQR